MQKRLEANPNAWYEIFQRLAFSKGSTTKLAVEKGHSGPMCFFALTNVVSNICNVLTKPGGNIANGSHDMGDKVTVMVQKNLKLMAFMIKHQRNISTT